MDLCCWHDQMSRIDNILIKKFTVNLRANLYSKSFVAALNLSQLTTKNGFPRGFGNTSMPSCIKSISWGEVLSMFI